MRLLLFCLSALWLSLTSAMAMSPIEVATVTPAYQAPGWSGWAPVASLGASLTNFWTADDHGTANMTDDGAGLISSWKDGVSALALTGATTARPTYSATSFNGVAGVTGDGTANALTAAATTGLPTGTTESWIFILCNQPLPAATRNIFAYGASTAAAGRAFVGSNTGKFVVTDITTDTVTSIESVSGVVLLEGHFSSSGALIEAYRNGSPSIAFSTAAAFNTSTTRTRMWGGLAASAASFGNATIRYVFVTGALTTLKRQQIEGWAASGLGLLPYSHPYRFRKP